MDIERELKRVAEGYASKGYEVTVRPGPAQLPPFAKDFRVELVGRRGDEGVLVAVKKNRDEVTADPNLPRYAEITAAQKGWRFDLAALEGQNPMGRAAREMKDFSDEDINRALSEAEQMVPLGFLRAAVITAWAALESAMRMRLRAAGERAEWGASPRSMLNELYSSGFVSPDEFRQLQGLSDLRNQIVHGFSGAAFDTSVVQVLVNATRRLVADARFAKQPA
ncbi:MAG: hypothetical protein JWO38_4616 [Gemmataceae bacterium]|nr:hypothetical protein [Gemmataceae bacterium]